MTAHAARSLMHKKLTDARPFDLLNPTHLRTSYQTFFKNYQEKYIKTNSIAPIVHLCILYTSLGYGLTHLYKRPYITTRQYH